MTAKLTEKKVRTLQSKEKRYSLTEDGLTLEVHPSGKKVWYAKTRQHGKQLKTKLGEYPYLSLKDAKLEVLNRKHQQHVQGRHLSECLETFSEFVDGQYSDWLKAHNKTAHDSLKTLRTHFYPLLGHIKLKDITPPIIEKWKIDRLSKGISPATVTRNLTEVRSVFSRASEWFNLDSPMPKVKNPKIVSEDEKVYLDDDELERLRETCVKYLSASYFPDVAAEELGWNINHLPVYLPYMIHVAINTGMRQGEILSLKWKDVDLAKKQIVVRGENAKSGKSRSISVNEKLVEHLRDWYCSHAGMDRDGGIEVSPPKGDLVFPVGDIKRAWTTFRERAGLQHIGFHTLRHHFASQLVLKNVALSTVMKLMGHSKVTTTQRYLSVRKKDEFEAVNLL